MSTILCWVYTCMLWGTNFLPFKKLWPPLLKILLTATEVPHAEHHISFSYNYCSTDDKQKHSTTFEKKNT